MAAPCSGARFAMHLLLTRIVLHQAEYAVSFGAKFCDLHVATAQFSPAAVTWINSVRKCLQVELVPLLRLCRRPPTCEEIRKTAFQSHQPCYFSPYGGFTVCKVTPLCCLKGFEFCSHISQSTNKFSISILIYCIKDCIQSIMSVRRKVLEPEYLLLDLAQL